MIGFPMLMLFAWASITWLHPEIWEVLVLDKMQIELIDRPDVSFTFINHITARLKLITYLLLGVCLQTQIIEVFDHHAIRLLYITLVYWRYFCLFVCLFVFVTRLLKEHPTLIFFCYKASKSYISSERVTKIILHNFGTLKIHSNRYMKINVAPDTSLFPSLQIDTKFTAQSSKTLTCSTAFY